MVGEAEDGGVEEREALRRESNRDDNELGSRKSFVRETSAGKWEVEVGVGGCKGEDIGKDGMAGE